MTLDIEPANADEWNKIVDRSDETNLFHRDEALSVLADHTGNHLTRLVGYNGNEPVGLFPVFETETGPFTMVSSPPRLLHTFQLGPAMVRTERMKRRRSEQYRSEFVTQCLEWVDSTIDPDSTFVRSTPEFGDVRPFQWNDFEAHPYYTYSVDITSDRETLLGQFSSDARSNVRNTDESAYEIEVGDRDDLKRVFRMVEERHTEAEAPLRVDESFVTDLYDACPEDTVRPYVCRVDGEFATGMITLSSDSTVYRWKGGARSDTSVEATDLLDWYIMRDSRERGQERYDLVGANIERLCDYKAKFGPDVETYYTLTRSNRLFSTAAALRRAVGAVA